MHEGLARATAWGVDRALLLEEAMAEQEAEHEEEMAIEEAPEDDEM